MGTNYVVIDKAGKNGLDIGKFHALAVLAGVAENGKRLPLTADDIRLSAEGWLMDWSDVTTPRYEMLDVGYSARLSALVARWAHEVAGDRPLVVCEESVAPWGDWQGKDKRAARWALWTLYTHPMTGDAVAPWRLFPVKGGAS